MNAKSERNAFLAQLSEIEGSSPQLARGVREVLRSAEKHDCFAGARFERIPGLVLSFKLGPCNVDRYFSPYQLIAHDSFELEVRACVGLVTKQRRSLTYGTLHANPKTTLHPSQGYQAR